MSEVVTLSTAETSPDDPEVALVVRMMRTALQALPPAKRRAALSLLEKEETPLKPPQRGGDTLKKVVQLFREDRRPEWTADQVVAALETKTKNIDRKSVYNALTYLCTTDNSRRILQKAGYGRYQLTDGSWVEGPP